MCERPLNTKSLPWPNMQCPILSFFSQVSDYFTHWRIGGFFWAHWLENMINSTKCFWISDWFLFLNCHIFRNLREGFLEFIHLVCWQNFWKTNIYSSRFTNVGFWTTIEFSNVVKCRWGSQGVVSSAIGSSLTVHKKNEVFY